MRHQTWFDIQLTAVLVFLLDIFLTGMTLVVAGLIGRNPVPSRDRTLLLVLIPAVAAMAFGLPAIWRRVRPSKATNRFTPLANGSAKRV